ncbi:MAG: MBL fold metallo-hydrolase [Sphingomonadales bacterium]|nr:MBL fold metallo-hydrolase [Sphingomonadales bacterium]
MQIGQITIRPVIEFDRMPLPPQMFIEDFTPADAAPHLDWLAPRFHDPETGQCHLSQHAWLVEVPHETGTTRILVDPCVGHQRNRPALDFYHRKDSPMLDNLAALGVLPEAIDYVFCTHLHLDRVGWNTRLDNGEWVPTFPNAKYIFSRSDEDFWRRDAAGEFGEANVFNVDVYRECIAPVIAAGLHHLADPGETIAGCLTLIDAAGHTVGHIAGVLESEEQGAVLAGDAIHHPIQCVYPDRPIHADDREAARQTRHRLLGLCADRDFWLAPAHFMPPHVCKVRRDGDSYRLEWPEADA